MKECKYKIWEQDNQAYGEIRFSDWDDPNLKDFLNLLAENIKNTRNLELLKDEGYPTPLDSNYMLFERNVFEEAKTVLENFRKEYPEVPVHPGFFSFLLKTKRYRKYQQYIKKRGAKEKSTWETIDGLLSAEVGTTHDYPYIGCRSKIHNRDELISEIETVAKSLKIELKLV